MFRYFLDDHASDFEELREKEFYKSLVASDLLIDSLPLARDVAPHLYSHVENTQLVVEHPRVPFVSYAYEWPFEMLKAAAQCQLDISRRAFESGYIVKDATPFNIQFRGSKPVFIDVASLERYEKGTAWTAYSQFCRMFLNPLLMQAITGISFQPWLRSSLDGIPPELLRRLLPWRSKLRRSVFLDVVLQSFLSRRFAADEQAVESISAKPIPKETVSALVNRMTREVSSLKRRTATSVWGDYEDTKTHYSAVADSFKESFVRSQLQQANPEVVWDLGCNRGQFSLIAAETADYVVAMDSDELSVGELYNRVAGKKPNILPLVVDFLNPSPDQGWAGAERKSLSNRGKADWALCLALVHHLSISGNIPLSMIAAWLATMTSSGIVEFAPKTDRMVRRLLSTKKDTYSQYTQEHFESCLEKYFVIHERVRIPESERMLYAFGPR